MEFKILTEPNWKMGPLDLKIHIENKWQMSYNKCSKENGYYRQWIAAMSSEQLEKFIAQNEEQLKDGFGNNTVGPNWPYAHTLINRNCLYQTELYLRDNTDTARLDEDLIGYFSEWKGKYDVAYAAWIASTLEESKDHPVSEVNPYY